MFQYRDAYVKTKESRGRWKELDVANIAFVDLLHDYASVVFKLSHPLYGDDKALDIRDIPERFKIVNSQENIVEFLQRIDNAGLPVTDVFPPLNVTYATFVDANQAGFNIDPVNTVFNYAVDMPKEDKYDLRLTKEGMDYRYMFDTCLTTVNGLFHRTNYTGDSLNILEGAYNGFHANLYQVGIYHLGQLGKIKTVPIRIKHVHKGGEAQPLGEKAYIEIDERAGDLRNKTVMVVIGGYLHLPGTGVVKRSGMGQYVVDFKDYPLAQRYMEMVDLMGIDYLKRHFDKSSANYKQVSVEQLYSDIAIQELLGLSQSFFVIIDTPEVFLDREHVEFNGLPGSYVCYRSPKYPLVSETGKVCEYWTRRESDRYVLNIDTGTKPNYLFETIDWKDQHSIDASRDPSRLLEYTKAFFWKLGKNV